MWDNKEGFPALPFSAQLVRDNKGKKLNRYRVVEANSEVDI